MCRISGSAGAILGQGAGQDVLAFNSHLQIQTVDLEATWHMQRGQWLLQLAAGGRYLECGAELHGHLGE